MPSPSFLVSGTGTLHSHLLAVKHSSFVSGFCPLPACTLSASKLSACQATPPSQILFHSGLFPNFSLLKALWLGAVPTLWGRVFLSNGRVLACLRDVPAISLWQRFRDCGYVLAPQKKCVRLLRGSGSWVMENHNTQLAPGVITPWCLCSNTSKHGCSLGSPGTFVCGVAKWTLPNALLAGELLLRM